MQPTYGVDAKGKSKQLSVDNKGRLLLSLRQHLTLTILLVGVNAQLGVIIWLMVR